jgi:hypothetical protein
MRLEAHTAKGRGYFRGMRDAHASKIRRHLLTRMIGFPVSLEAATAEERWWKSMM